MEYEKLAQIGFDLYQSHGIPIEIFLEDILPTKGIKEEDIKVIGKILMELKDKHRETGRAGKEMFKL